MLLSSGSRQAYFNGIVKWQKVDSLSSDRRVLRLQLNIANPSTSQQKKLEIDDDSKL